MGPGGSSPCEYLDACFCVMERLLGREGTLHLGRLQTLLAEGSAYQDDAGDRGHSAGEEAGDACQHGDLLPGTNILQGIQADGRYSRCAGWVGAPAPHWRRSSRLGVS